MRKSRILKAHQVLMSLEELRFNVVTIANLSNPFVTDEYEKELYNRLADVETSIQDILKVDLYGTAVLLEEVGKVIEPGGVGVTISSQSGHRMEQLGEYKDRLLAMTPTEELLQLDFLQPHQIKDTLHAYQLAKRCNEKRVMAESVIWGQKRARINSISPGIIVTPLAIDEFNGPRGDFYKNMFASCPAKRPGTADEVANVAELLMSPQGAFITGSDFLIDGGATASYFYGSLQSK